jgi:hypothetical protein
MTAAPEWLIGLVDRLRGDYKDGNYYRSREVAQQLIAEYPELRALLEQREGQRPGIYMRTVVWLLGLNVLLAVVALARLFWLGRH